MGEPEQRYTRGKRKTRRRIQTGRIHRKNRYGTVKLQRAYERWLTRSLSPNKAVDAALAELRGSRSESLDDYFESLTDALLKAIPALRGLLEDAYEQGSGRVYQPDGSVVRFEVPSYEAAVDSLTNDGLKLARKLASDQREKARAVLVEATEKGWSVNKTRDQLTDRVRKLTENRARTIARTEVSRAQTKALGDTMKTAGIERYLWIAALDTRTCEQCKSYHRREYEVDKGPMPVRDSHPNCRCVVVSSP